MTDDIDEKLARVSGRLQAGRDRVRAELGKEPGLLALAEAWRERFGARLVWVKTDGFEYGREIEAGVVPVEHSSRAVTDVVKVAPKKQRRKRRPKAVVKTWHDRYAE